MKSDLGAGPWLSVLTSESSNPSVSIKTEETPGASKLCRFQCR